MFSFLYFSVRGSDRNLDLFRFADGLLSVFDCWRMSRLGHSDLSVLLICLK